MTGEAGAPEVAVFLAARLDELEEDARAAAEVAPAPWVGAFKQVTSEPPGRGIAIVASTERSAVSHHVERWEPAAALADIAADRKLLDALAGARKMPPGAYKSGYCEALEAAVAIRAQRFSGHPEWKAEWQA